MPIDILIRGGSVTDGSGATPRKLDVGVRGERIEAVGDLSRANANTVIDAANMVVSPGFIDSHSHMDLACFLPDEHRYIQAAGIRQGVTTEVVGNCGFSPLAFLPGRRADVERHGAIVFGKIPIDWPDLDGYRVRAEEAGLFGNLAPLIGHGGLRAGVFGFENRPPTADELMSMVRLAEEAMVQGAFGLSSGLIYAPGTYADTEEVIALCGVLRRHGRPYTSHIRGETHMVADSVREAIRIGKEAAVAAHISHHKVAGKANWGRSTETLGLIESARRGGTDVTADVYPYTASSTLLYAMLPPWVQIGGQLAMVERLQDAKVRERIRRDFREGLPGWENLSQAAAWDGVVIASCPGRPETEGKSIADLAAIEGKDGAEFVFDLLVEQGGQVLIILHLMDEEDVRRVLSYAWTMIGSDGTPQPGKPHPRLTGTFSRVLGRYARDQGLFALPEAIRKMTSLPAERFGLRDRGVIAAGKKADLVILDPNAVADQSTFANPLVGPAGVAHVLVSGKLVIRSGELTGAKPGRVLAANS